MIPNNNTILAISVFLNAAVVALNLTILAIGVAVIPYLNWGLVVLHTLILMLHIKAFGYHRLSANTNQHD